MEWREKGANYGRNRNRSIDQDSQWMAVQDPWSHGPMDGQWLLSRRWTPLSLMDAIRLNICFWDYKLDQIIVIWSSNFEIRYDSIAIRGFGEFKSMKSSLWWGWEIVNINKDFRESRKIICNHDGWKWREPNWSWLLVSTGIFEESKLYYVISKRGK